MAEKILRLKDVYYEYETHRGSNNSARTLLNYEIGMNKIPLLVPQFVNYC
jgi:hypothetical protein